jgi:hypothetical protein
MVMTTMQAKTIYVATDGSDDAAGTIEAPMATLPAAYKKISNGDTICFRGGTYHVTDEQVMKTDNTYAYVFALEKAGTATKRTCIMGYPGERPIFDFSALQLDGTHRFSAFYLGANYLHLRNCDAAQCTIENNTFAPAETAVTVTADLFVSTDPATLFAPRDADGNLPEMTFLRGKEGSLLAQRQMGWAWVGSDDTAIHTLPDVNHHSDSPFYSLNGIPVPSNALEKGIYIHQGRMIVVK